MCQKGWTAAALLSHPERLTTPLMRSHKRDEFRPVPWDEALDRIAAKIVSCQEKYGQESVGVFGGGGLTNEKAYLLGKFARVALRTPHVDYNGRFCMSAAATAAQRAFGIDRGLPFPLADIANTEAILLVGSNLAETMPPVMQYLDEQRARGGHQIMVDPRATPTVKGATLHLRITPGTDLALANGLLHIAARDGLLDEAFIAERTRGFDGVRRLIPAYWPERVERITGIPATQLNAAAHLLGEAATAMILTARGAEQQSKGTETVLAFINLALALGKVGKPYCGYGTFTGQGNGQGGREHGLKAGQLPGYRCIDNPMHRAIIASVWGVDEVTLPGPGRSAYELLDSLGTEGGVQALLILGSNVAISAPHAGHIHTRLKDLEFLVVSDLFLSETAALADVVLPTTQWAEEEGTMTNVEGRVLWRRRALAPPAGVLTDTEIVARLAQRLGFGSYFSPESRAIFDELRRASRGGIADYAGITYERIAAEDGIFWPCPHEEHPGTPRLFSERFHTEDGRACFHAVEYRPAAEEPDTEYPLYLTTGRVRAQYQSGTQTRRVEALSMAEPEPFVEIHPAMAQRFGIAEGDMVRLTTRRGSALVKSRLTPNIRMDTLFMPFHWGGQACANRLTNPALDPDSKMPEFKVCAARLELARRSDKVTEGYVH
jgi:assimilatory nitrate reductase catalytic subunit